MVNRNFGAPEIVNCHRPGTWTLNLESTYSELNKLTQISRSETRTLNLPS